MSLSLSMNFLSVSIIAGKMWLYIYITVTESYIEGSCMQPNVEPYHFCRRWKRCSVLVNIVIVTELLLLNVTLVLLSCICK